MKTGFPFEKLLGGNISEFKVVDNLFNMNIGSNGLPAHLRRGYICNNTGQVIATDYGQLSGFLNAEFKTNFDKAPFSFVHQQKGLLMKTFKSGNSFITVMVNKSNETRHIQIKSIENNKKPTILFADKKGTVSSHTITISPEETVVIKWM